jgi:SAM-dependent methyltransferase
MTEKQNPWIRIPAGDYEGHMNLPGVAQTDFLNGIFNSALCKHDATSVALLGCATGNGLENIQCESTKYLTVIDINPEFIEILKTKYGHLESILEPVCADLKNYKLKEKSFTLIFAGLIFEYLEYQSLLESISSALTSKGVLVCVLQLPSENISAISESPFQSLKQLQPIMKLVSPEQFLSAAEKFGLKPFDQKIETLPSGKSFFIASLTKSGQP